MKAQVGEIPAVATTLLEGAGLMNKWPLQPDTIMRAQHRSEQFILKIVLQIFTKAEQVVLFHYY